MIHFRFFIFLSILSMAFFACSDDDGDGNSSNCELTSTATATGKLNGDVWTFQGGRGSINPADSIMTVRMFGMDEDLSNGICNVGLGSNDRIFFDVPAEVGEYALNSSGGTITMYDVDANLNYLVSSGCMEITSVTDTEITIVFNIGSDPDYQLVGQAVITVC